MWSDSEGERELRPHEHPPARALAPPAVVAAAAAAASAAPPTIAHLNVSKNSRMHIGPKFVSVTQTVHSTEVIKGRALGLELEAGAGGGVSARRLRCSVAVFVCWALVVATGLAFYVCQLALTTRPQRLDLGLTEPWYLRRGDWQAMPSYGMTFLALPVRYALVGHSATTRCEERYNCTAEVLEIQREHQRRGWDDIGPNFLVSGNGLVFEGRGANVLGAMVRSWNARSVSLMFLGDYRRGRDAPSSEQLQHAAELLAALVGVGALHPQYTLLAHCQAVPQLYTPGQQLIAKLDHFDHWDRRNVSDCLEG